MKMIAFSIAAAAVCVLLFAACSHKNLPSEKGQPLGYGWSSAQGGVPVQAAVEPIASRPVMAVLKATAFKMSGDYSNRVAVTLGGNGELLYFPAPTDLGPQSTPVEIGDGWWLNRQGLGANSVFTKWTFDEYRALKATPSPSEIKAAIIPGARVTEFVRMSIPASKANQMNPHELIQYIEK